MRGSNRIVVLLVIVALLIGVLAISSGGFWEIFAYDCRQRGEMLHASWRWYAGECYIQQPDGNWTRVDTNPNVRDD